MSQYVGGRAGMAVVTGVCVCCWKVCVCVLPRVCSAVCVSFAGQADAPKHLQKAAEKAILTDEHAPNHFRVSGPLSQFAPFAQAFQCAAGAVK